MQEKEKTYLKSLNENKKKRRWAHIFAGLCGIFVATGVFGALVLPGLGLDGANQNLTSVQEEDTINQGLVVSLSADDVEAFTGEMLSVTVNSSYSKANTEGVKAAVRLTMGVLPEGVAVEGFNDKNELKVVLKNTNEEEQQYIILKLVKDEESKETYIEYELPEGAIVEFDVQLSSKNGIMPAKTDVSVNVKDYTVPEGTAVTVPEDDKGVILTWKADHEWKNVDKTVSAETIKVNTNNQIAGQLVYTITAESSNKEEFGEIWTRSLTVKDTFTLPENISLPEGATTKDGAVVTKDGTTILSFTQLQGGTVTSLVISEDKKTISYELSVPNSYIEDGVPTQEQDHLKLEMTLLTTNLVLPEGYRQYDPNVIKNDLIKNHVELVSVPYQEYPVTSSSDEVATEPTILEEEYSFWKSSNGSNYGAGSQIMYTLRIINDGEISLPVTDENGKPYLVTDKLPDCVYMTDEQVAKAQEECAKKNMAVSYDKTTNTLTWNLGIQSIGVGTEARLDFWATIEDAKTVAKLGFKDGDLIYNTAEWRGKPSNKNWVAYNTAKLYIEKTVADASKDKKAQNGEELTYTLSVRNTTNYESIVDEVIKDTLPEGVTFKSMMVKRVQITETGEQLVDGETLTGNGTFKLHETEEGCKKEHTGTFSKNGQDLEWTIGCLQANERIVITYTCTVDTDQLSDKKNIKNTASITDGSFTCWIGVDYPLTVDKQVTAITKNDGAKLEEVDLLKAYEDKTIFDYKITVSNAAEPYASKKETMVVEDCLPTNMLPYDCTLYQIDSNGKEVDAKTLDLFKDVSNVTDSYVWSCFVKGQLDTNCTYFTEINDNKVQVERIDGTIKLTWNVNTPSDGASYEISYRAQIILTTTQYLTSFKNIAIVDGAVEKDVTVYGGRALGNIKIAKQFFLYDNNDGEKEQVLLDKEDPRWKNIKFELTGIDPDGNAIVFGNDDEGNPITLQEITMDDFQADWNTYTKYFYNIPVGTYTLKETGYEDSNFQLSQPELGKNCNGSGFVWEDRGKNEITFDVAIKGWSYVYVNNRYYTKDTVNLQKSVYALVEEDTNGNWTALPDKYLFAIDNDSTNKKYVIYNITVSAQGGRNINIESLTDQLPEGLSYVGVCATSYYLNKNSFVSDTLLSTNANNLLDQTILNQEGVRLQDAVRIKSVTCDDNNKVTFGLDFGGNTNSNVTPNTYKLYGGRAFTFLLLCEIDENQIVAGQDLTNTVELKVTNAKELSDSPEYQMVNTPCDSVQNNGKAVVVTDDGAGNMTIKSSVTITPENTIVPGIEKNAKKYILTGTKKEETLGESTNIPSNSAVKWEITLHNNGTEAMSNYKVADTVTSPFHLMNTTEVSKFGVLAAVSYQLYDYNGNKVEDKYYTDIVSRTVDSADSSVNSYEFDLSDAKYAIPSGYYAILTVYTNNVDVDNQVYKNTATLLPTQSFVANKVRFGELTTDSNGVYNGVVASDYVYALGKFASISWKTITEKTDTTNTAKGNSSKNYISVDQNSDYVIYSNNIQNVSENNFNQVVVIDLMPMVNDTGVINRNDKRGSEFSVLFNGGLSIQVLDANGKVVQTPVQDMDYTLEFSAKTGFTTSDFAGAASSSWHSEWTQDDRSFRVVMNEGFYLNPQYTLVITYEGKIDSAATPGTIAWNSFGYQYCASGLVSPVRAEPPKVGVMIPAIPIIQKEVIDSYGDVQERDADIEFTFALWNASVYETDPANAKICEFTICQGGYRELTDLTDTNGNEIKLENGKSYVITELTDNMPENYEMVGIGEKGGTLADSYAFTYYNNKDIRILARNLIDNYQMELPETGGTGTGGFTIGGILLMSLASFMYGTKIIITKKKERTR